MKKTLTVILAVLLSLTLAACGGNGGKKDEKVIKVGATLVPHAEILKNVVADKLAKDGWTLEVVEFNDYVTPNTALEEGELDANYFQTLGYMKDQNENGGLHLDRADLIAYAHGEYHPIKPRPEGFFGYSVARPEVLERRLGRPAGKPGPKPKKTAKKSGKR